MSDVSEILIRRRSIRKFADEKLSSEETELILRAALLSPTSKNSRSWEFVVIEDKEMLEKLSKCKPNSASFLTGAALAVVVLGNPILSDVWIEDASIASTSMLLQAEDLNIGACWIQVRERNYSETITSADYINDLLNIPAPLEPLCILAFGRKEKPRTPHDIDDLPWEKVHIGSYRS
ncbi:MAG TPA: nitroreductase family protein [Dysgonamonadaceae bacterium]|jgi:nitroreductase|nr:nitroreductase family protein [Dysgonamonadaceae bacterium]HQG08563.1 nitroreductase family protein [Dysgonamonadaceae bacterium]HQI43730.1 nitroreductase family protein [Dysgonamonadaceae bacterium]